MFFDKKKAASGLVILGAGAITISSIVLAAGGAPGSGAPGGGGPGGGPGGGNMGKVELAESVISVNLQTPETGDIIRSTEFVGKIQPAESVSVYPEASGKIANVYYDVGQTVQKGSLLLELDSSDAELSYKIAQASYDQKIVSANTTLGSSYDSKLQSAKTQLETAQQNLNNARLKLKDYNDSYDDEVSRAEKQMDKAYETMQSAEKAYSDAQTAGDKSDEELSELRQAAVSASSAYSLARANYNDLSDNEDSESRDLRNSYKNAQTSYDSALENYNLLLGASREDTEASVDADLKSAELSLEQSATQLSKLKLYSPISGVIQSKLVDDYGSASQNTAAFVISNQDTLSVEFNASADAATALSMGDTVTVAKSGKEYAATIIEIDVSADEATGLFPIKARIEENDGTLLTGVTVKVSAATQKAEDAMLIPIDLVYYDEGQAYVFTYADGKAHRTDIETGISNSETVVVASGLSMESQIITTWHPDLKDGAAVQLAGEEVSQPAEGAAEETIPGGGQPGAPLEAAGPGSTGAAGEAPGQTDMPAPGDPDASAGNSPADAPDGALPAKSVQEGA